MSGGLGSILGGGLTSSIGNDSFDWSSGFGGGGGGGGWGSFFGNVLGGLFGGGDSSQGGGNIWGQMLAGGLNGYAQAGLSEEMLKIKGKEDRMSTAFEAQLIDHYKQRDKVRKRQALDTYGQFSTIKSFAPNYQDTPAPELPPQPQVG